ncbi:MAG: glycoside hydrolase family 16 protein, partial [Betaproteobacteria bacterium]
MAQNNKTRELETVANSKQVATAPMAQAQALLTQGSGAAKGAGQLPLGWVDVPASPWVKAAVPVGKRKAAGVAGDEALVQGADASSQSTFSGEGWLPERAQSADAALQADGGGASALESTEFSGARTGGIELAQLELPANPSAGVAGSSAAAPASSTATGAASSFGGVGGMFGAAAGLGLAAGGGGGGSSAGSSTPIKIASPTSAAPVPTAAASDVISLFSDKYTNVPVTDWNPYWNQSGALSDANAINGDHIKRILNLNYQGVQIANTSATSGLLDVSSKASLHIDFWLQEAGAFTLKLISKDGAADSKEAGVKLIGSAGWNSIDIDLNSFTGVDLSKIYQMQFVSGGNDGSASTLHFDNVYFSSTVGVSFSGLAGRLVNGYIKGALVFQDNDGDGQLDNNKDGKDDPGEEPYTYTGADGQFSLPTASPLGGPLITQSDANTIDVSTGLPVTNVFKAPANAKVISPLSTLLEAGAKAGLTETQLKTALGIDPSTSLLQLDPVAAALSGTNSAAALQLKAANVMVSNLMDVGNSLIQGKSGASSDFSGAVVNSLVNTIKANPTGVNLSSSDTVGSVLSQAATVSAVSSVSDLVTAAASQLASANTQIKAAAQSGAANPEAALLNMAKLEKVVQSTVAEKVNDVAKGTGSLSTLTQVNVQTQAAAAEVPPVLQFKTLGFETAEKVTVAAFNGASYEAKTVSGNTVIEFTKAGGDAANAAGVSLSTGKSGALGTITPLGLSPSTETKLGMWVNSAREGTRVTLEIGDSLKGGWPNDGNFVATEAVTTKAGWEYLTFDFAKPITRYVANGNSSAAVPMVTPLKPGITYDMVNVFFDLGDVKLTSQKYQFDGLGYAKADPGPAPAGPAMTAAPAVPEGYSLAFSDEFGGAFSTAATGRKTAPDASKWALETGKGPNNDGWGNGESQTYTNSLNNAYVQSGALHIVADKSGSNITSARLKSVFDVLPNGYVEVKAAMPAQKGAWPAIWLLGQSAWPATGEIDIMEWTAQYFKANQVQAALHFQGTGNPAGEKAAWTYGDTQKKDAVNLSGSIENFHTYQVWWTQDYIRFGVDANNNDAYYQYNKPANATSANWPFTNPMDLILNLAIGGSLGGAVPEGDFSYEMLVDYVKVYQGSASSPSSPAAPTTAPTAPTAAAADVVSLYSDAAGYTTTAGFDLPYWGQGKMLADATIGTNHVLKGDQFTYQGFEFAAVDATAKGLGKLHMDIWSQDATKVRVYVISKKAGGGAEDTDYVEVTPTAGAWKGVDIDLSQFPKIDPTQIFQVKLDTALGGASKVMYFDNIYFGKADAPAAPSAPTTAPTAPTAAAADVVS